MTEGIASVGLLLATALLLSFIIIDQCKLLRSRWLDIGLVLLSFFFAHSRLT